jgi:hypothetical protein
MDVHFRVLAIILTCISSFDYVLRIRLEFLNQRTHFDQSCIHVTQVQQLTEQVD